MAGRILNSKARDDIANCLVIVVQGATTRQALINLWRIAKIAFGPEDTVRLPVVTGACHDRNTELGFTPTLKPEQKGGKPDA